MYPNKRILNAGKGEPPLLNDGAKVVFNYRVNRMEMNTDGVVEELDVIDDSRQNWPKGYGKQMEIIYGKKFKLPIWETCLSMMRVDEIAQFVLQPKDILDYPFVSKQLRDLAKERNHEGQHDHNSPCGTNCMGMLAQTGLGYKELDDWLKEPKPLLFTFHLLHVMKPDEYEQESWTMSAEEKLSSIPMLKEAGNQLFHQGSLKEAEEKYSEALSRLESLTLREKPGEPEWLELEELKVPFYLNLAQVKYKQEEFYAAIEAANEVMKRQPSNAKALFRRAKAYVGAWNLNDARRDLEKLRELDPTCANMVNKELNLIDQLEQKTKSNEAARFRNIFR